jgi:F-type H+-transporting ATPase subunit delta
MKEKTIAKVYAQALLELGDEKKINIADELTRLTEVINASNELENLLFLELFTLDEKKAVFTEIANKLSLSAITTETINFLIDEKRIGVLPMIVKEVIVMDDDRRGFIKGTIEGYGEEIDPAFKEKITSFLKEKLGRTPHLEYKTNSNMTAGYRVTVEDLQLDASLDNQLEQFKQSILSE